MENEDIKYCSWNLKEKNPDLQSAKSVRRQIGDRMSSLLVSILIVSLFLCYYCLFFLFFFSSLTDCKSDSASCRRRMVIKGQLWSGFGGMGDKFDLIVAPSNNAWFISEFGGIRDRFTQYFHPTRYPIYERLV
jgi:hypothetical protein